MQSNYYSASTWIKPHLRAPMSLPVIKLVTDTVSRHEYFFMSRKCCLQFQPSLILLLGICLSWSHNFKIHLLSMSYRRTFIAVMWTFNKLIFKQWSFYSIIIFNIFRTANHDISKYHQTHTYIMDVSVLWCGVNQ